MIAFTLSSYLTHAASLSEVPEEEVLNPTEEIKTYIIPVISGEEATEIEKNIIFDASQSFIPEKSSFIKYQWDFGDGSKEEGIEVTHSYEKPGQYTVTLIVNNGNELKEVNKKVFAYKKAFFLITDDTESEKNIQNLIEDANQQGIFMKQVEAFGSNTEFISENILTQKLLEETKTLQKTDQIIIWTKETSGLSALQNTQNKSDLDLSQKNIIIVQNDIQSYSGRIKRLYNLIKPNNVLVVQEASLFTLIRTDEFQAFQEEITKKGYKFELINESSDNITPWNFMSVLTGILSNKGIPDSAIALLLLLPVIATIVTIMRQVVGITTFGIYTPSIITLTFLIIGIYAGVVTLTIALMVAFFVRVALKQIRMLYIPKMALVICSVSLAILLFLVISIKLNFFDFLFYAESLSTAIFPVLILSTLAEKFISADSGKSIKGIMFTMLETVFVSIIAYIAVGGSISFGFFVLQIDIIKRAMIVYPELIFLIIIFNLILGKWTGLRLLERYRFREILKHNQE